MINIPNQLIGYEELEKNIFTAIKAGRLGNAILFLGPSGVGKYSLVKRLSNRLLNTSNQGHHPDFLEISFECNGQIEKKNRGIGIDEIRKVKASLCMTAANNSYRIAAIDGADYMSYSASNALLKILEEPGDNSLIFLTANSISSVLPTVRSRCKIMRFSRLGKEIFNKIIFSKIDLIQSKELDILYGVANGNIGLAIKIYNLGGLEHIEKIRAYIEGYSASAITQIINFASKSRDHWEIIKNAMIYFAYLKIKSLILYNLPDNDLKKYQDIINRLCYNDYYSLDQSKIIMLCLI